MSVTSLENSNSTSTTSHCWEPDGSFHSVCIFVLSVSALCTIATIATVYRIVIMIMQALRYLEDRQHMKVNTFKYALLCYYIHIYLIN